MQEQVARLLASANGIIKDTTCDTKRLHHYVNTVVQQRGERRGGAWTELYQARYWLD